MQITPKTTYAVRCMVYLKDHPGKLSNLEAISTGTLIPQPFLSKILQNLTKSGLIRSAKGKKGGFMLAFSPERINLYDIVRETSLGKAILKTNCGNCSCQDDACPVLPVWTDLEKALKVQLSSRKLSQL